MVAWELRIMQTVVSHWRKIVLRYYLNYLMKIILIVNVIKQALAGSFLSEGKYQGEKMDNESIYKTFGKGCRSWTYMCISDPNVGVCIV